MARLLRRNARSKPSPSHAAREDKEPPAGATEQPLPPPTTPSPPAPLLSRPEPLLLPLLPLPEPLLLLPLPELLLPCWQTPPMHMPPGHALPSGFAGLSHIPIIGSHVP